MSPLVDTPFSLDAGDVTLGGVIHGDPEARAALVVVHGGPGISHDNIRGFDPLAGPGLAVVYYDQRGVGRSSRPPGPDAYGLEEHIADLEAIRAMLGRPRIHVLGYSWGGLPALAHAASYPDAVASLALVCAVPPDQDGHDRTLEHFAARAEALAAEGLVPKRLPEQVGPRCEELRPLLPLYFADPARVDARLFDAHHDAQVSAWTQAATHGFDLAPALPELTVPTLVIHGAHDPFGLEAPRAYARRLPATSSRVVVLDGCGHAPMYECPDRFFPLIAAAIEAADSTAGSEQQPHP